MTDQLVLVRPSLHRLTVGLAALVLASFLTGCYSHVVRAEGPGSRNVDIYERNMSEERIPVVDDVGEALFGR